MGGILGMLEFSGDVQGMRSVIHSMAGRAPERGELAIAEPIDDSCGVLALGVQRPLKSRGTFSVELIQNKHFTLAFYGVLFQPEVLCARLGLLNGKHTAGELMLMALEKEGVQALSHVEGHFSGAFWDNRNHILHLFVDSLGVKTLYYMVHEKCVLFASDAIQIKAAGFPCTVSNEALSMWCCNTYDQTLSMWNEIKGVGPGQVARYQCDTSRGTLSLTEPSRKLSGCVSDRSKYSYNDWLEELRNVLLDAVRPFIVSGQPVSSYLSGGMDSTTIAAMLSAEMSSSGQRIHAFNYAFKTMPECDESELALETARKLDLDIDLVDAESFGLYEEGEDSVLSENPFVSWHNLDRSIFRTLSDLGSSVILTGHGGDNLFTGALLPYYFGWRAMKRPWGLFLGGTRRQLQTGAPLIQSMYRTMLSPGLPGQWKRGVRRVMGIRPRKPPWFSTEIYDRFQMRTRFFAPHPRLSRNSLEQMRREYALCEQWGILRAAHYLERLAAPFGVEVAHPFLNRELIEFVLSVPADLFFRNPQPKGFLRDAMVGYLPDRVVKRYDKPLLRTYYYRGLKKQEVLIRRILDQGWLRSHGWIDYPLLRQQMDTYFSGNGNALAYFLFPLNVEIWIKNNT